jgi:hypothetical protein
MSRFQVSQDLDESFQLSKDLAEAHKWPCPLLPAAWSRPRRAILQALHLNRGSKHSVRRGKCGWKSESRVQRSIPWSVCVLRSVQGLSYLDRSTKTLHLKGTHVLPVIVCQSPFIDTNPPLISWFSLSTSQKPPRRGRSRHSPSRAPWMWWIWRRHKALSHTTRWQCLQAFSKERQVWVKVWKQSTEKHSLKCVCAKERPGCDEYDVDTRLWATPRAGSVLAISCTTVVQVGLYHSCVMRRHTFSWSFNHYLLAFEHLPTRLVQISPFPILMTSAITPQFPRATILPHNASTLSWDMLLETHRILSW